MSEKKTLNKGYIVQVQGPIVDVKFSDGTLPQLLNAIEIKLSNGETLVTEVMQHIGDDVARSVAMGPTEGLARGIEAIDTGAPIQVPVGEKTLGRMFNILGNPIDDMPFERESGMVMPIHRLPPSFQEQTTSSEILSAMSVPWHLPAVDTDWHPISSAETFFPSASLHPALPVHQTFESAAPYPDIHTRKQMLPVLLLPAGLPPVTAPAAAQTNRCHPENHRCHRLLPMKVPGLRYQCPLALPDPQK